MKKPPELTRPHLACPCTLDGGKTIYPSMRHMIAALGKSKLIYANPDLRYILSNGLMVTREERKALGVSRCLVIPPKMDKSNRNLRSAFEHIAYLKTLSPEERKVAWEIEMHVAKRRKQRLSAAQREAQNRPEVKEKIRASNAITNALPEVRARRSESLRASHSRPEVRAKIGAAISKAYECPELKARVGETQRRVQNTPEVKAKTKITRDITNAKPETKENRRQAALKALASDEVRAKMSAAQTISQNDPVVRAKIRQSQRETFATQEYKDRQSAAQIEAQNRPEVVAKRSASLIKSCAETDVTSRRKASLLANGSLKAIVTCPHCGKAGGRMGMKRWHFDACKLKAT